MGIDHQRAKRGGRRRGLGAGASRSVPRRFAEAPEGIAAGIEKEVHVARWWYQQPGVIRCHLRDAPACKARLLRPTARVFGSGQPNVAGKRTGGTSRSLGTCPP